MKLALLSMIMVFPIIIDLNFEHLIMYNILVAVVLWGMAVYASYFQKGKRSK